MESMSERAERDEFRARLKQEWALLWGERFDDRVRAEGISIRDYPLLLVDKGLVIFASRDAKTPSFSEVVSYWSGEGRVYSPDPDVVLIMIYCDSRLQELGGEAEVQRRRYEAWQREFDATIGRLKSHEPA